MPTNRPLVTTAYECPSFPSLSSTFSLLQTLAEAGSVKPTGKPPRRLGYLIEAVLLAGEGEGETQGQGHTLHAHVLKEVGDALDDVVKELRGEVRL